jgi:hypothetical protein
VKYLVHESAAGVPLGIFSEDAHYYPTQNKNHQEFGVSIVTSRRSPWLDFLAAQSSRVPGRFDRWEQFSSVAPTIADAFNEAVERLSPPK